MNKKTFYLGIVACATAIVPLKAQTGMDSLKQIFPQGAENTAFAQNFTGKSYLAPVCVNDTLNQHIYNVTFEPGCRNNWHSHTGGQLLICTAGVGYYQERGCKARRLVPGDVVEIAPNVEHWHGAAPDQWFSHLAVECNYGNNQNTWLEPVSDEQYAEATARPWDKVFAPSDKANVKRVYYRNRYGLMLAADLYTPADLDENSKYPALVIGAPYGGVKEQSAGLYAQTLAGRGFVAIAFDPSFKGNSEGEPRQVSSPDIFVEDFSAGVDFLGTLPYVNREHIGAIGICGSGGFAVTAAQVDKRIKAVATASMYDISRVTHYGWEDCMTPAQYQEMLDNLSARRWADTDSGVPEYIPSFPAEPTTEIPAGLDPIGAEFWEYYAMKRGHHPHARANHTTTSNMAFANFPLMQYIETISPRPILFIMGEKAHSRYFTEDAYKRAAEPKELVIVPGARHIDLYDGGEKGDMIPFDKIESFFKNALQ